MKYRRSAYGNWSGSIGRLVWSYDIRNDRHWRKRRWKFRWTTGGDFLTELRKELEKVRNGTNK